MTKRKLITITCLFFIILICLRMSWIDHFASIEGPNANQGTINLRDINLPNNKTILLNGEWEFYSNQYLQPDELRGKKKFVSVPNDLSHILSEGYGTYRLKILLKKGDQNQYSLYVKSLLHTDTIFINGHNITETEQPLTYKKEYFKRFSPYTVKLGKNRDEIDIVIHIPKNTKSKLAGILETIEFGTTPTIEKKYDLSVIMQFIVFIILFLHSIYCLIFYVFSSWNSRFLYLGLSFFCLMIGTIADDDRLLLLLFPTMPYEWWIKIIAIVYSGSLYFLIHFLRKILPHVLKNFLYNSLTVLFNLYLFLILLLPVDYLYFVTMYYFQGVLIVGMVILISFHSWKTVYLFRKNILYFSLAVLSIVMSTTFGMIINLGIIEMPYYPIDIILSVIFFAILAFKTFFQQHNEMIILTEKLQ